jgi:T4 RnlA family RNA ligase
MVAKETVTKLPIVSVSAKEDGSILSFIRVNGKSVARSKTSFGSEQAIAANALYNNIPAYREFIDGCLDMDIVPIFEYVAPTNRIVLIYEREQLILLRMRNRITGEYITEIPSGLPQLERAPQIPFNNWDEIYQSIDEMSNAEGYVIEVVNPDGTTMFVKLKCPWYITRHGLMTEVLYRPNLICKVILDGEMDDLLSSIPDDLVTLKTMCSAIWNAMVSDSVRIAKYVGDVVIANYTGDRKAFALAWKTDKYFSLMMNLIDGKDIEKAISALLGRITGTMSGAIEYLNNIDASILAPLTAVPEPEE